MLEEHGEHEEKTKDARKTTGKATWARADPEHSKPSRDEQLLFRLQLLIFIMQMSRNAGLNRAMRSLAKAKHESTSSKKPMMSKSSSYFEWDELEKAEKLAAMELEKAEKLEAMNQARLLFFMYIYIYVYFFGVCAIKIEFS